MTIEPVRIVAILETMWNWRGMTSEAGYREAPRYFRINPNNFSGRRLYKLINGNGKLLVTNACRELADSAKGHGTPNPEWLRENLHILDTMNDKQREGVIDLLLVCGKVAQATYKKCGYTPKNARAIEMPHPAARGYWNKETILTTQTRIKDALYANPNER